MVNKFKRGIKKYKSKFIVALILWVVLAIVFVSPVSVSIQDAMEDGKFDFAIFFERIGELIINPFKSLGESFNEQYIGSFWGFLWKFTLVYFLILCIGIVRYMPKHEYDSIEHGSSDWCENGEEYKILSKNRGIILAQKIFLPVNKRGNVNVLVVGRFRFRKISIICYS